MARQAVDRSTARSAGARATACLAILLEGLWPLVFALACLAAVFLALAWFGVLALLPGAVRLAVLGVFALAALVLLVRRGRGLRWPSRAEIETRVERASGLAHQPLRAQSDRVPGRDPFAQALWSEHQRRMAARLSGLKGGAPDTRTERLDPVGLRALLAGLLVVAFAFSFGPNGGRLTDAVARIPTEILAGARVDAWVTPPGYTGKAPVFLTDAPGVEGARRLAVPQGSTLSVRISDRSGARLTFAPASGATAVAIAAKTAAGEASGAVSAATDEGGPGAGEYETVLTAGGTATLETSFRTLGSWTFDVISDKAPAIRFEGTPAAARNGALELAYAVTDDYGVAKGRAEITLADPAAAGRRPLVKPPEVNLALPRRTKGEAKGRSAPDLTESPYAGAAVRLTLVAEDDAKQVGRSAPLDITLPERRFTDPLARAVVEQRRILALDAGAGPRVLDMLDAVTSRGEDFIPNTGAFIALKAVRTRIAGARGDADLQSAVDFLWQIALGLEDGDVSLAEKRLRDAQEALSDALENGASDEEIAKLMDELRAAMGEYMQAMAEAMRNMPPQNQMQMGEAQEIRPQDLDRMLDRIEDLARSGSRDAAKELLAELQDMMNNLQAMRPNGGQQQQSDQQSPMQGQMNQLGQMLQRQQELMNETFRLGREEMRRQGGENGMEGQDGEPQEGAGRPMTAEELREAMKRLQAQQGQLQKDLQALGQAMEGQGMKPAPGLGEAGEAMGRAEGALGQSDDGTAVSEQGQAMAALRKGAQDMMEQMQQAMGEGQPGQGQLGQGFGPGQQRSGRDPLGRERQTQGPDFGQNVDVPDEIDIQRARQILDAIRQKLGNRLSPQMERDYLERLLKTP